MLSHLVALFTILFAWFVFGGVLVGLGACTSRWLGREAPITHLFWAGLSVAVAFLQIWHLAFPVNLTADFLISIASTISILLNWRRLKEIFGRRKLGFWPMATYALIVTSLAFRATGPCEHFDTGLYGATAVRWILSYPVVPGLANLHGRLGFNSSTLLCVAAMGQGIWRDAGHHLFGGLLVGAFWATIIPGITRIVRNEVASGLDWFQAILAIPCFYWTTHAHLVGTVTDLPGAIVALVAAGIIFGELLPNSARESRETSIVFAIVLFSLAVTFKSSIASFASLSCVVGLVSLWFNPIPTSSRYRSIAASLFLSSVIVIPWVVGNVILTGLPLYPLPLFGLSVDWKVPPIATQWMLGWLRSWARTPFAGLDATQGWHWLAGWFQRNILVREGFQVPLILSLAGSSAAALLSSVGTRSTRRPLWLLVPSFVSLALWFVQAPAPRFAEAALWTAAASLVAVSITLAEIPQRGGARESILVAILLVGAWCVAPHRLWRDIYHPLFRSPVALAMPKAGVIQTQTDSGLIVYWRMDGQQCWDAPIPCTPYFDKSLRLRTAGEMRWGFDADEPRRLSDLASIWTLHKCTVSDVSCSARRIEPFFRDHGSE